MKHVLVGFGLGGIVAVGALIMLSVSSISTREAKYPAFKTDYTDPIRPCLVHSLRGGKDYKAAFRTVVVEGPNYSFKLFKLGDLEAVIVKVPRSEYALVGCQVYGR